MMNLTQLEGLLVLQIIFGLYKRMILQHIEILNIALLLYVITFLLNYHNPLKILDINRRCVSFIVFYCLLVILGTPFVVITVTATLSGFDHSVTRAASSLGSDPVNTFMKITLPLILPGVISGGLFAFVTSFDEVVVVLFLAGLENTTIPIQMWTGLREQLSPTILAVATCLIILSTLILVTAELLRRRSERLRGINR